MIHAGAIVGAVLSQMRLETLGTSERALWQTGQIFRNDKDKRDFVSIGCACGVAGAFSAPVGGVLFVLEEAASHWRVELTWLTFFGTITCVFISTSLLALAAQGWTWPLVLSDSSFVAFGSFEGASKPTRFIAESKYSIEELPVFILIGVFGGVLGKNPNYHKQPQFRTLIIISNRNSEP